LAEVAGQRGGACNRCPLACRGRSVCGVVDLSPEGVRDRYPWKAVYMSLIPVEEIPLYHACPGGLAARIVVPGAPWTCRSCFWSQYTSPESLVLRDLTPREFSRFNLARPDLVLVDGGEPLIHDWVFELPKAFDSAVSSKPRLYAFRTTGVIALQRLEGAASRGYSVVVFEYTLAVERPPRPDHVGEALSRAYKFFDIVEIHFLHDGSRRATIMLSGLASKYPEAAIHVIPINEQASDNAYDAVEKLRDKGYVNLYLYRDESYTLTDTVCPECGTVAVSRKPWGVKVAGRWDSSGRLYCRKCGRKLPVIVCGRGGRRAIHREIVVW
jgi:hypothetical protein